MGKRDGPARGVYVFTQEEVLVQSSQGTQVDFVDCDDALISNAKNNNPTWRSRSFISPPPSYESIVSDGNDSLLDS